MNSADEAYFARRAGAPPGHRSILYHGSVFERYGVFDLLAAFERIADADRDARLSIVGGGDARDGLERLARSSPYAQRIEVSPGFVPMETVAERLAQAHIAVVPNHPNELNRYALSTKLLEAVAVGVPVVCAGLPTIREHFSDDELLFFEPGDATDLGVKLQWALGHYDEMLGRAAAAAARYDAAYAWSLQKGGFLAAIDGGACRARRRSAIRPGG
jgi:glycosyltransferase involved in cell wall biosynthesis